MDRNWVLSNAEHPHGVALRKESVDRNGPVNAFHDDLLTSLSARRAWIEIVSFRGHDFWPRSLSARRAWIEMGRLN